MLLLFFSHCHLKLNLINCENVQIQVIQVNLLSFVVNAHFVCLCVCVVFLFFSLFKWYLVERFPLLTVRIFWWWYTTISSPQKSFSMLVSMRFTFTNTNAICSHFTQQLSVCSFSLMKQILQHIVWNAFFYTPLGPQWANCLEFLFVLIRISICVWSQFRLLLNTIHIYC